MSNKLVQLAAWQTLALAVALVVSGTALAQQAGAPAADAAKDNLSLLTYEVGDLVMDVPDYSLDKDKDKGSAASGGGGFGGGGRFGGGGAGMPGGPYGGAYGGGQATPGPQPIEIGRLADVIQRMVAPDTWYGQGPGIGQPGEGPATAQPANQMKGEGRIEVLGASLVVLQQPAVHHEIEQLLDRLRSGSSARRTLSIDARWLLLSSDDLDRLVSTSDKGAMHVDRKALAELTRQSSSLRTFTNCFSGQLVYLISGTRRSVVSGYIPVVGSIDAPSNSTRDPLDIQRVRVQWAQFGGGGPEGGTPSMGRGMGSQSGVGYQPLIEKPNFGVQLEIRPTLQLGKTAVIDLKSSVTFQGVPSVDPATDPVAAAMNAVGVAPAVDRIAVDALEFATTMIVPLGEPVLVGGMTHIASSAALNAAAVPPVAGGPEGAASEENRQLYLVLELK